MTEFFQPGQEPRAFFVARIREQAKQENFLFSDFELRYLTLSERGQDKIARDMLDDLKGKTRAEFSSRISGLAWRAYQQDISAYSGAEECYQNAMHELAKVDDYPNLGMYVCCIALKTSPEVLDKTSWWPTIVVLLVFLLLGLWGLLHR